MVIECAGDEKHSDNVEDDDKDDFFLQPDRTVLERTGKEFLDPPERTKQRGEKGFLCSVIVRVQKGGLGPHPFPFDGLDQEDSDLEENIEGPSHQGQVKDIRSRCDDGREDRNEQEGVPPNSGTKKKR